MKNIILIIMLVFSIVWSQDAVARQTKHKKKPSVSQKHSAKSKGKNGYRSSYLAKRQKRSVASTLSKSKKGKKVRHIASKAKAKKKHKRH